MPSRNRTLREDSDPQCNGRRLLVWYECVYGRKMSPLECGYPSSSHRSWSRKNLTYRECCLSFCNIGVRNWLPPQRSDAGRKYYTTTCHITTTASSHGLWGQSNCMYVFCGANSHASNTGVRTCGCFTAPSVVTNSSTSAGRAGRICTTLTAAASD